MSLKRPVLTINGIGVTNPFLTFLTSYPSFSVLFILITPPTAAIMNTEVGVILFLIIGGFAFYLKSMIDKIIIFNHKIVIINLSLSDKGRIQIDITTKYYDEK